MNVLKLKTVKEFIATCSNMYRLGWDERNGGNISVILDEEINLKPIRQIEINFDAHELLGKCILVTGTGKYFKNVEGNPSNNIGIIKIVEDGTKADILWGFVDGGRPTSELPTHLMSHITRLKVDPQHKVVMHCHPTNTLTMTYIHSLDEREFTRTLWQMCTECLVVFPDGVAVLPWMLCGNSEIGRATAEKLKDSRACVWAQHGIFGAGKSLDETFGLIETIEKAAEVYIKTAGRPIVNTITDEQLKILADAFGVVPRKGYLTV